VTRDQNELVDLEQLKNLIRIAEARLTSEETAEPADLTDDERAILDWFLGNAQNERVQWVMYGTESFAYLESVAGDVRAWIKWIKQKYEYLEQFNLELAEKELSRMPHQEDTDEPKWRIVVRLEAISHTMRPKALAEWNKNKWPIALYGESGKKDLRVEITFPKRIPLQHLWEATLSEVMAFVSALNIGSRGLFWWYTPRLHQSFTSPFMTSRTKPRSRWRATPHPLQYGVGLNRSTTMIL
jgi:hypothetical protein